MNMIIGKRQIILASLVVGLGIAVYLNWNYAAQNTDFVRVNDNTEIIEQEDVEGAANYGEAQYVDRPGAIPSDLVDTEGAEGQPTDLEFDDAENETFFVEAKMSRQKARDEAVETLATMLADAEITSEQKAELAMRASDLASSIEIEGKIENLIKAKGFTDVMVYYDAQRADIMIRTEGLVADEVVKIKDIILKETEIPVENISIIEVN